MGIISDTYEDTRDRQADEENLTLFLPSPGSHTPPHPIPRPCPVCFVLLYDAELNDHLLRTHAHEQIYVRLNGRVVRDGSAGWSTGTLHECEVELLGIYRAYLTIQLNGRIVFDAEVAQSFSLLPHVPPDPDGCIFIQVRATNQRTREFTLYCGYQSRLEHAALNHAVWELQQNLDRGVEPDWERYSTEWMERPDTSDLEHRYLRGFYAYTLAMWLDHKQQPAASRPHLEEAFSLLSPFNSKLARTALGILALRMNTFDYLRQWRPFACLQLACAFFVERDLTPRPVEMRTLRPATEEGLYVDSYLEIYLDALLAFYAGDDQALSRCLVALEGNPLRVEPNNDAKYWLLQARVLVRGGRSREARACYEHLADDPTFASEAQEYLT